MDTNFRELKDNELADDTKNPITKANKYEKDRKIYDTRISFGTSKQKKKGNQIIEAEQEKQNYNIKFTQISFGSSKKK